jgi:uncharacterized membrane protein
MLRTLAGLGLGAALMYLLDPRSGRRRRAKLEQQITHALSNERRLFGKAGRDLVNRAHALRLGAPRDLSDEATLARVHAAIGHVANGYRIDATVDTGTLVLRGDVIEHLADSLVAKLRRLAGVTAIDDRLVRHRVEDATVRPHAGSLSPGPRVLLGAAGAVLALRGGTLGRIGGVAMLARAIANDDFARIVGMRPATLHVDKTITIDAPIERVFALFTKVQRFPVFMEHVRSVRVGDRGLARWVIDGPFGLPVTFDAQVAHTDRGRAIVWKTLPDSQLEHTGSIRFEDVDRGTRVHIHLRYTPPGGLAGHALARALGFDPRSRLDDDVMRAKALLENGKTRAHHHRVKLGDIPPYS